MRSLWKLRRVRLYVYIVAGCVAVTAAGGVYAAVRLATAAPLPLPLEAIRAPRDQGALPEITGRSGRSRIDPKLSRVSTEIIGEPVEVRCWSSADWRRLMRERAAYYGGPVTFLYGYAVVGQRQMHLPGFFCELLLEAGDEAVPRLLRAQAAETFAHELEHLRGATSEARTECYGYQTLASVARVLGVSRREARRLAGFAWKHLYDVEDTEYGSRHCHDGGAFDLHPTKPVWP